MRDALAQAVFRAKLASQTPKAEPQVIFVSDPAKDHAIRERDEEVRLLRLKNEFLEARIKRLEMRLREKLRETPDLIVRTDRPRANDILRAVSDQFDVPIDRILCKRQDRAFTIPRHVAMYLMHQLTSHSMPSIARALDRSDHTTVRNAIIRIQALRESDKDLDHSIRSIEAIFEYDAVSPPPTPTASLDRAASPSSPQEGARSLISTETSA